MGNLSRPREEIEVGSLLADEDACVVNEVPGGGAGVVNARTKDFAIAPKDCDESDCDDADGDGECGRFVVLAAVGPLAVVVAVRPSVVGGGSAARMFVHPDVPGAGGVLNVAPSLLGLFGVLLNRSHSSTSSACFLVSLGVTSGVGGPSASGNGCGGCGCA